MFLGIDTNAGLIYESVGSMPDRPVMPLPMVSQAKIVSTPSDWVGLPANFGSSPITMIFREDSFDPVTRSRRGRLYQSMTGAAYPNHQARVLPHPFEHHQRDAFGPDGKVHRPLSIYAAATSLLSLPDHGLGAALALGNTLASSAWRIVDAEITVSDDVMISLRALSTYGILPPLDSAKIEERFRDEVQLSMRKVLDAAFKESPTSVVDQCKDAATVIASRWIAQQSGDDLILGKDLAKVGEALAEEPRRKNVAANIAKSLAILHARGKTNEQVAKGLTPPCEEDAEFAIQALGMLVREIGWDRSRS